ncbi:hypothetical protein [Microcoleus sp. bin38.metabat.b11b12b14.051]|uniref:hypothetical protein n=1 Tax=Microcoleus sp. bin38.metabat.b11b12b14.051 TaxID=2742709 RepID=UPI0025F33426|nr:hypothetical protein [Microcoleus sp. bin38.metabat.b11b12b14.051]
MANTFAIVSYFLRNLLAKYLYQNLITNADRQTPSFPIRDLPHAGNCLDTKYFDRSHNGWWASLFITFL